MSRRSRRSTPAKKNRPGAVTQRPLTTMRPQPLPPLNLSPITLPPVARPTFKPQPLADRRTFHPDGQFRPAPAVNRNATRLVVRGKGIGFANPRQVITCMRRNIRKQVLFALKVGGQKGRKNKPRRNWHSSISC